MTHLIEDDRDTPMPAEDDGGIPAFLRREPAKVPQQELFMRTDTEADTDKADATAPAATEAPAKPARKAAKPKGAKASAKAAPKAKANGAGHAAPKAAKTAKGKAAKGKAAKAAPKAERHRDPAKLDQWGFRKDSIKSRAAAMYAKGKGATLADVKDEVGSVQFNLLRELEEKGFRIDRDEVKNDTGRVVTRYKLHAAA